jgi:hypothetical protein
MTSRARPREIIEELYLVVLSRLPTEEEVKHAETYAGIRGPQARAGAKQKRAASYNRRDAVIDITWALINSTEFLYRH